MTADFRLVPHPEAPASPAAVPSSVPGQNSSADEVAKSYAFILSLQRGEPEAIRLLYWEHHVALRILGQHLLGSLADAEDLLHEVFLAVPAAMKRYRGDCSLRTFLEAITVKRAGRFVRTLKRYRRMLGFFEAEHDSPVDRGSPEQDAQRRQLSARLAKQLGDLPYRQRAAVVLCLVEGRSGVEAAEILGIPDATVRTRLFHARKRLRARLRRDQ